MSTKVRKRSVRDFRTDTASWWCPGCGDFGVLAAMQQAAAQLNLDPENVVLVAGIGCSGKIGDYFNSYSIHAVHGRTMPVAAGIKLANRNLTVIAAGGDGDGYGIGLGHFVHAARRNMDITYIVMDNHIYGLTKGQFSPTSKLGFETISSPSGSVERPIQPLQTALTAGATFIGQAFSGDPRQMTEIMKAAITHRGFALVNCGSPCVTYNKVNTYEWFGERLVSVDDDPDYDRHDIDAARRKLVETDELVTGIIYQNLDTPSYDQQLPGYREEPLVTQNLTVSNDDLQNIMREFA